MKFNSHKFVSMVKGKLSKTVVCEALGISQEDYNTYLEAFRNAEREYRNKITSRFESILNGEIENKDRPVQQDVNLAKGEMKLQKVVSERPKTPEEIIELLQIDTSKWRLSQFWNKEKNGYWEVSALCTQLKAEETAVIEFLDVLSKMKLPRLQSAPLKTLSIVGKKIGAVISLQDLHFGKPGNEDMGEIVMDHLVKLIAKTPALYTFEKIYFVLGGDLLNADTFDGTTTKGTIIENSERTTKAYLKAFTTMFKAIDLLSQKTENLEVVYIPGNHDRLSSFHLAHALNETFRDVSNVNFDINYLERKVKVYANNFFGFEHGDVAQRNGGMVWPTEFSLQWGSTMNRYVFTGHVHKNKTMAVTTANEESGLFIKVLPSLSTTDYYHYKNKWTMNHRSSVIEYFDPQMGLCGSAVESLEPDDLESLQKVLGFA